MQRCDNYATPVLNICWRMFQVSVADCAHSGVLTVDERTRWALLPAAHQRYSLHTCLAGLAAHLARVPRIPVGVRASPAFPLTGAHLFRTLTPRLFGFL